MPSVLFQARSILFAFILVACQQCLIAQARSIGSDGCELCFYGPDNIVFDVDGNAYITDTDHKTRFRVLKVSRAGKAINEWRVFEKGQGRRKGPEGIAIDHDGNILVTDGGTLSVLKISPHGKVVRRIGYGSNTFEDLGHIAIDSSGDIYIAEAAPNRIQKFSSRGERLAVWKRAKGSGLEQWNSPETIAVRTDGTLIVEDWGNRRMVVLSPSGQTVFSFGGPGEAPGQFASSSGLCVDHAGNIYVSDDKLRRIQKFDPSGRLLSTFANDGDIAVFAEGPGGVAVDERGNVYAPDGLTIVKLSPNGRLLERWH